MFVTLHQTVIFIICIKLISSELCIPVFWFSLHQRLPHRFNLIPTNHYSCIYLADATIAVLYSNENNVVIRVTHFSNTTVVIM